MNQSSVVEKLTVCCCVHVFRGFVFGIDIICAYLSPGKSCLVIVGNTNGKGSKDSNCADFCYVFAHKFISYDMVSTICVLR